MTSPIPFILLYSILNNVMYVNYPPRVLHGMVCFENNINITGSESCDYMKIVIINNNTAAYSYEMKKLEYNSNFFKILFYYPNNTIFDTNWIKLNNVKNQTIIKCDKVKNEEETKCLFSFILNVIMTITSFSLLSLLLFIYFQNRV